MTAIRARVEKPKGRPLSASALERVLTSAVNATLLDIANAARDNVPTRTGAVRRSITVETATNEGGVIRGAVGAGGQGAPYAKGVEFGTGVYSEADDSSHRPIVIRPLKPGGVLAWPNVTAGPAGGKFRRLSGAIRSRYRSTPGLMAFARFVVQQGNRPRPFLRTAFAEKAPGLVDRIAAGLAALFGG